MKSKILLFVTLTLFIIYSGCRKDELAQGTTKYSDTPVLPEQPYQYPSQFSNDPSQFSNGGLNDPAADNQATLGRVLFYDKKMSLNNSVSCGNCHQQSKGFCDGKQFSTGLQDQKTRRNAPGIVVHDGGLFWDGRAHNFHDLALMPLVNHVEMMNYDISKLEKKVAGISYYPELFTKAYGSDEISIEKIQSAIAAFLSKFLFTNNRFNQGGGWGSNSNLLTTQEKAGMDLFFGKATCGNCHNGRTLDGWVGAQECIGLDETYADNGIGELTRNVSDNAKFRVPTLLNIEYTAPYMHDGRFKTLEEVVEHYNSGVKNHPNLSWALRDNSQFGTMTTGQLFLQLDVNHDGQISDSEVPSTPAVKLGLNDSEKRALVAFLKTLSDPSILTDIRYSDPFVIK